MRVYTDAARDDEAIGLGHHLITEDLTVTDRRWMDGSYTSMEAEYIALLDGIRHASYEGRGDLEVYVDCEPLVKKMRYPDHRSQDWRDRREGCQWLLSKFDSYSLEWIPRSNNERANRMAYEALEEARRS